MPRPSSQQQRRALVAAALCVLLVASHAARIGPASSRPHLSRSLRAQQPAAEPVQHAKAHLLLVKDHAALAELERICQAWPLACEHVYRRVVKGVAGRFTDVQLQRLRLHLGDKITCAEEDGQVHKSEGPDSYQRSSTTSAHTTPQPPSSSSSGAAPNRRQFSKSDGLSFGLPGVSTDGGADSVSADRIAWLRASYGDPAQQSITDQLNADATRIGDGDWQRGAVRGGGGAWTEKPGAPGGGRRPPSPQLQQQQSTGSETHDTRDNSGSGGGVGGLAGLLARARVWASSGVSAGPKVTGQFDTVALPVSPPTSNRTMPSGPSDLPNSAPGPSQPLSTDAVSALATDEDQPTVKVQRVPLALWGLDRIDQRDTPLDKQYKYGSAKGAGGGEGVTIYQLDSGIRLSHQEFRAWEAGQPPRASYGYDFVDDDSESQDCDGHGTHVAATVIGRGVGVAKSAKLVAVRVLDCKGSGTISDTVAGLDWVVEWAERPAVVVMSLGVPAGQWSRVLEAATLSVIGQHGISVIVASGNAAVDACSISPANLSPVITVGGTNLYNKFAANNNSTVTNTTVTNGTARPTVAYGGVTPNAVPEASLPSNAPPVRDELYRWSNIGPCVDIFAPGVMIWSACGGAGRCPAVTDDAYTWASGTSMAVPHVAGVAALYLGYKPNARPDEVKAALVGTATMGRLNDTRLSNGTTANRLLYSRGFVDNATTSPGAAPPPPPPVTLSEGQPLQPGLNVSALPANSSGLLPVGNISSALPGNSTTGSPARMIPGNSMGR